MAAGRRYHWKHGWIPISPEAKAYVAGRGPKPTSNSGGILSRVGNSMVSSLPPPPQLYSRKTPPTPTTKPSEASVWRRAGRSMISPLPPPPPLASQSSSSPNGRDFRSMTSQQRIDAAATMWGTGSKQHRAAIERWGNVGKPKAVPRLQGGVPGMMALARGHLPQLGAKTRETDPSRNLGKDDFFFANSRGPKNVQIPLRRSTLDISDREMRQAGAIGAASHGLVKSLHDDGGFTFDPRRGGRIEVGDVQGVAVAVPGTETAIPADGGREAVQSAMISMIGRYQKEIANGAMIGGWYSEERDQYMVELTQLVPDRESAIRLGRERNQEAVFDMETGETISTGGTGDKPIKLASQAVTDRAIQRYRDSIKIVDRTRRR